MKKIISVILIIILLATLFVIISLDMKINKNMDTNENILNTYKDIYSKELIELDKKITLPNLEINKIDYSGFLNIDNNLLLPVESTCSNSLLNIASACIYSQTSFIILTTTFKDSLKDYELYDVNSDVKFTNMLGKSFKYKIREVKRISRLTELEDYDEDLIIVIENYHNMEYVLFICE